MVMYGSILAVSIPSPGQSPGISNYLVSARIEPYISVFHFQSEGQWLTTGLYHHAVSLDKNINSTFPLFAQAYKWVPVIVMLGGRGVVNLAMD